ncbi:MAG TPA: FAD-dependent oxidoreductase [Gemmatimonadaceae bacterium]|nr:FAD-dependent oxidoreductase [Gemmatimonadaceae bacterium]
MTLQRLECDVAVIGAGPAGIAASVRAAENGARVIVVDEGVGPGGQIWRPSSRRMSSGRAANWRARLGKTGATVLSSTAVVDAMRDDGERWILTAESASDAIQIVAKTLILATGARERFLPFPGWTLPNVFGIGGAQALLKSGMSFRGRRVVIAGSGPLLLPVAASLAKAGADVALVAEQAPLASVARYALGLWRKPSTLAQAALLRAGFFKTRYSTGTWVTAATGEDAVRGVTVTDGKTSREIDCDVLCAAFGLVPNTELARLLGCRIERDAVVVNGSQETTVGGVFCAGEPTGIGGVDLALAEGEIAGATAAGRSGDARLLARRDRLRIDAIALDQAFALRAEVSRLATPDTIVCRCEDVRLRDLDAQWSIRQAKLYTRAGMGPCQGRICGAALECLMNWSTDSVRPPTQPARLATFLVGASATMQDEPGAQ